MSSIEHAASLYRSLRLNAVSRGLETLLAHADANQLSYLQFAEQLAEHECAERNAKRIALHRKQAQIPVPKSLEEFDYRHQTSITKRQANQLLDFSFIDNRANLIFIGPPDPLT
ncbi:MAG: ATP-binding protein [Anaerolineales bacterium]|nr:ATP-binding protein [Anaerolineales bacterium]MCB1744578.1 ATP-binding protein [Gammaproteobacteria bacterium]